MSLISQFAETSIAATGSPQPLQESAVIAQRLQARDPQILDQLILQYQHRLLRYLLFLTGNRELAEDLFQETWMRVLLRGSQFKGNAQFVTWLFRIARNLVLDLRRNRPLTKTFGEMAVGDEERAFDVPSQERTPLDHCVNRENSQRIAHAVLALRQEQREIIILRFQEEMSLQEIADLTGSRLSTVKARLYRGIAAMKAHITRASRPIRAV